MTDRGTKRRAMTPEEVHDAAVEVLARSKPCRPSAETVRRVFAIVRQDLERQAEQREADADG